MPDTIFNSIIEERNISVHVSERAKQALSARTNPLHVNMELYFSCFIKKMVSFSDVPSTTVETTKVTGNLFASFRPVQSRSCNIYELSGDNTPTLIDLPIVKRKAIVPKHLFIDCKKGKWKGDFTWSIK